VNSVKLGEQLPYPQVSLAMLQLQNCSLNKTWLSIVKRAVGTEGSLSVAGDTEPKQWRCGYGYGVMLCRKGRPDGVLIGCSYCLKLKKEEEMVCSSEVAVETMKKEERRCLRLRSHTCNYNTAARLKSVSA